MAGNFLSEKRALRQQVEGRRRALSAQQVERWGGAVQLNLAALPLFEQLRSSAAQATGRWVALYAAASFEVPTWSLLEQLGHAGFPRVVPGQRTLAFHSIGSRNELVPHPRLALLEPPATAPLVPLAAIALFVVPGVAFTVDGRRLGRGSGAYDSTLAAAPHALTVGVCFDCCVVADLPTAPHDRRVDVLVTESRTLVLNGRA
jgi:5-formyltetrahydrofolate cyclo-ligase